MLPNHLINKIEDYSKKYKISDKDKKEITEKVQDTYNKAKIAPGESIGVVTAESFGEPSTQMSLAFSEKVIVKIDDKINIVKIGEFVDELNSKFGAYKINEHTEVLPLNDFEVLVPSINQEEKVEWKKVVEVSKHKSPNKLMKIVTASGRKIIATDNHSFVSRINNMVLPIVGRDLKIGERIPSLKYLPEHCTQSINVSEFIDFPKADDFRVNREYRPTKIIPSNLDLDLNFGWMIGAYLAEGNATGGQLCISNLDDCYIANAKKFVKKLGLEFTEKKHSRGFGNSRDFIINSSLLAKFFRNTCGNGSSNKFVPEFAYSAKEEFVAGLLRGYFDGDANFTVTRRMIRVSSNSEELLDGIKLLLTRFGIFASKSKDNKQNHLIISYKYSHIFLEKISSDIEYKRKDLEKLVELAGKSIFENYKDCIDMIGGFGSILLEISKKLGLMRRYVNSATKRQKIGRTSLLRHIIRFENAAEEKNVDISNELLILKQMLNSDVVWDEISNIEYVKSENEYVYDFSVPGLETFTTFDGIITHNTLNTFHFAGVAEMNITVGLPRLIEIFDARKKPSTPKMEIPIKSKYSRTVEAVREVAMKIKETKLSDILQEISINIAKQNIEINLDKKRLKDLDLKSKYVIEKLIEGLKSVDIKENDSGVIILKPKEKEITLSEVYKLKEKAKSVHIRGLEEITHVLPVKDDEGNYIIHCAGSNLKDALLLEEAETERIMTNDIFEIGEILGIEAARAAIIDEASKVIKGQGIDIDVRHTMFLADVMTRGGVIKGVTRTGIVGEKESVLARASFETPIKHIVNASLVGERDNLNSVVENVIINQPIPLGTGLPGLIAKIKKK